MSSCASVAYVSSVLISVDTKNHTYCDVCACCMRVSGIGFVHGCAYMRCCACVVCEKIVTLVACITKQEELYDTTIMCQQTSEEAWTICDAFEKVSLSNETYQFIWSETWIGDN